MVKILITGSKGFIGSAVTEYLSEKGYEVVGITEDVRDKELIRPCFKYADFVIHAAGEVKDVHNKEKCYSTNVLGTKNVAELCLENGCKMIHFSSIAENAPYGRSKQASQILVENMSQNGLKTIILRLCHIVRKNPAMKKGRQYPLESLLEDIEKIIQTHDFDKFELIDYKGR